MNTSAHPAVRLLAFIIDWLIQLLVFIWILYYISQSVNLTQGLDAGVLSVILLGAWGGLVTIVHPWLVSHFGGDIGKLLCGIAIVDNQGKSISFKRAFFRTYVGYLVSGVFFNLGFIWMLIDKERKGWHDLVAETKVVVRNSQMWVIGLVAVAILLGGTITLGAQIMNNVNKNMPFFNSLTKDVMTAATQFFENINNTLTSEDEE